MIPFFSMGAPRDQAELTELVGLIPLFLDPSDPRPAHEQLNENYAHGGGWNPRGGNLWKMDKDTLLLRYPEDPPLEPIARGRLRDEVIVVYECAFVAIIQKDGSFEVARMD